MIRYSLHCGKGHGFDSWFQNADAFDALARAGQLACPVCGDTAVEKGLMAPSVTPARKAEAAQAVAAGKPGLTAPASELEEALAEIRRRVEANSEYVGMNFVAEARAMHEGEAPERSIYGEARPEEARKLLEEGVPVAPLPFLPSRKAN
ncbi:DUF1178 family protein [Rhodobacter sp. SGA-6-6]|uniref:DUF1178 family protein n=1 Tax=Rhodobacter sp. SGA-6-6 TaxID=2710882 RepID=UPI0013EAF55B|nr:DUF1178 family protein [Rhodobacter sp. SGA-6-6]NGM46490.1 DUF1178 family protein [Rhodobacter sp. SGA-6-6]